MHKNFLNHNSKSSFIKFNEKRSYYNQFQPSKKMFSFVHKTLFRSLNITNVIKGRFFPKKDQTHYLFNLCTSFEIYDFDETRKTALQSKHYQQLFSKAFYMCIGPNFDGADTFFVIRDLDIIQFQYSEAEDMFISINNFELPKSCITPNFASFNDDQLIVSCIHGGLCGYDILKSEARLSFEVKPCTSVLQSFPVYKDCFFRIETGPCLTFYHTKPFGLEYKRNYDEKTEKRIIYSFPFGQEGIIFCTDSSLKCVSMNSEMEISFPENCPFDPIIDHSPIAPSDVLILTRKGYILRLQSNLSLNLISDPKDKASKKLRIFDLDTNYFLIINKCDDHIIFDLSHYKSKQILCSTIGLSNISIFNQELLQDSAPCAYAPQTFSYADDTLFIFRQGISLSLLNEFELPDIPTGLFNLKIEGKDYIIISYANGSQILEIIKSPDGKSIYIQKSSTMPIYEDEKTIGVITFGIQPNQEQTYQVLSKENAPIPYRNKTQPNSYPDKTVFTTYTKRMYIRITEKNQLYFSGCFKRPTSDRIESVKILNYDLKFIPTYLTVSPPDQDGISEYIVLGAEFRHPELETQFSVIFQIISDEPSEREDVINEKFPSRITSIEFFVSNPNLPLGILIGLENGSLIVGDVNIAKREIETNQIIQLGVSPCRIRLFKNKAKPKINNNQNQLIFGLSTRMWLLEIYNNQNLIKAHPFFATSPSFMTMDDGYRLFLISGKIFSIYVLYQRSPINPDFSVFRKTFSSQIVSVKIVDEIIFFKSFPKNYRKILTPLLIVVCKKDAYIVDSTYPNESIAKILSFDEKSEITRASYTNRSAYTNLIEYTCHSYLAISTISTITMQNHEYPLNLVNIYQIDFNYLKYAYLSNDQKRNPNQKMTLLKPILSYNVNHTVDAMSITCSPYSILNQVKRSEPFIVIASCNMIYIYSCQNKKLCLLSKIDHIGSKIYHLYASLEIVSTSSQPIISIYVSDVQQSVSLFYFDLSTNHAFLNSEEGSLRPISSEITPYRIDIMCYCGGDRLGNFFIFSSKARYLMKPLRKQKSGSSSSNQQNSNNKEKEANRSVQRLNFFYNFNVGDVITGVDSAMEYDQFTPYPIWYCTIGGSIGCFLEATTFLKCQKLLSCLEEEISKLFFSLTNCDSLTFRNKYYQSFQICDMDVIEIFHKLTHERKEYIIKKLLEKNSNNKDFGLQPEKALVTLESEILKCTNFFCLWNKYKIEIK